MQQDTKVTKGLLNYLPAVKDICIFYWISRPWDLSHRIGADFLSNLPYKLVQMVGYGSENDPVSSDFEILTFICCFSTF